MRILLVNEDPRAAQGLAQTLRAQAYAVDVARGGAHALHQTSNAVFDLVILDVGPPRQNGFALCRRMREEGLTVPILMLTARDAVEARIEGLDSGADDCLAKPFELRELVARVRSLLRRPAQPLTPPIIQIGPVELDTRARQARRDGAPLSLSAREYALLEYLMLHAETVVGRITLTEHVWEAFDEPASNAIDVCVRRLRKKIDRAGEPSLIVTRRGEGYMVSAHRHS